MLVITQSEEDDAWYLTCGDEVVLASPDRGIVERVAMNIAQYPLDQSVLFIHGVQAATGMSEELARHIYVEIKSSSQGVRQ